MVCSNSGFKRAAKIQVFEHTHRRLRFAFLEFYGSIGLIGGLIALGTYLVDDNFKLQIISGVTGLLFIGLAVLLFLKTSDSREYQQEQKDNKGFEINKKTLLYSAIMHAFSAAHFYLVLFYLSKPFENLDNSLQKILTIDNILLVILALLRSLLNVFLSHKIHPLILSKYSFYVYVLILIIISPFVHLTYNSNTLLLLRILLVIFNPYYYALDAIIIDNFFILRRFTLYTISSFLGGISVFILASINAVFKIDNAPYITFSVFLLLLILFFGSLNYYRNLMRSSYIT